MKRQKLAGCLIGLFFDPEDGGSKFLSKSLPDYTVSYPRKQYSSKRSSEPQALNRSSSGRMSSSVSLVIIGPHSLGGGVRLSPLGTSATNWPIVPAPDNKEYAEFGGMRIDRGSRRTRRKPAQMPLCPLQIPHELIEPRPPRWEAGDQAPEL
jgi:hypothetical protein